MTYDLALYPASGPGLGHLMRCYALAEAAVEMKAKVLMCLTAPTSVARWPCAVALAGDGESMNVSTKVAITDGYAISGDSWQIIDAPRDGSDKEITGFIYPHFGATPIPGYPTLYGEQWMPLRKQFRGTRAHGDRMGVYRLPSDDPANSKNALVLDGDTVKALMQCRGVVVPPSTIAYEAMALGVNVELHDGVPGYEHIAEAMVKAGVATFDGGLRDRGGPAHTYIDGLGAKRILEALL